MAVVVTAITPPETLPDFFRFNSSRFVNCGGRSISTFGLSRGLLTVRLFRPTAKSQRWNGTCEALRAYIKEHEAYPYAQVRKKLEIRVIKMQMLV